MFKNHLLTVRLKGRKYRVGGGWKVVRKKTKKKRRGMRALEGDEVEEENGT
jgi:hypothetical protein